MAMVELETINNFREIFHRIFPQVVSLNNELISVLNHSLRWPKTQQNSTTTKVFTMIYINGYREDAKRN